VRIVHVSDLHLGFRGFQRIERGGNLRERDLAAAFRWSMQEAVRLQPGMVLITGDIFDRPHPPGTAHLSLHRTLLAFRRQLPATPILVIAGARDTPMNAADPGPVAVLEGIPGIEAAAGAPRSVRFRSLGVHALLVPHRAVQAPPYPEIRPDPEALWNLLLIRGHVTGENGPIVVRPDEWSYVAIGGSHRATRWVGNAWTAGTPERPGGNPWRDAVEERGFLSVDLATGGVEFHAVPGRPVVDLAPVRVSREDPEAGTRRLRDLLEGTPGGISGKIVRVRLRGDVTSPAEGIGGGLLAAILSASAHTEFRLLEPGPSRPILQRREGWLPGQVGVEGGDSSQRFISVPPGCMLLTSESEADRLALVRTLLGPDRHGAGPAEEKSGRLWISPPCPEDTIDALLWRGTEDPVALLRLAADLAVGPAPERGGAGDSLAADRVAALETPAKEGSGREPIVQMEAALQELRADAVEASGDMEARMLEWARERQDADSKLLAYRDRARELRQRLRSLEAEGERAPCPTCGRSLGTDHADLTERLREEWEALVQDGRWWKRRREQLEEKPEDLRRMEEESLRLHSAVEAAAESLERLRERERSAGAVPRPAGGATAYAAGGPVPPAPDAGSPDVRMLLRAATNLAASVTGGRVAGIRLREGKLRLHGPSGVEWPPEGNDLLALRLALRLALAMHVEGGGGGILLWECAASGSEDVIVPFLEMAGELLHPGVRLVVVAAPSVLERIPERFQAAAVCELTGRGRWAIRRLPVGEPVLTLAGSA